MKILIINFNLKDQTREEYDAVGIEAAPLFTKIPGLISKYFFLISAIHLPFLLLI